MVDIIVLGATGYTGRLITRYLYAHPERSSFSFGIAARSRSKLNDLVSDLSLDSTVQLFILDIANPEQIDAAVQKTKVVINAVGPYWRWGTPVVRSCVQHGKHYVDLAGETPWVKDIIHEFDYVATKTGAVIVPCCGLDSVPSDAVVHISNKTLKNLAGPTTTIDLSTSSWKVQGGVSGGTISSIITALEDVPRDKLRAARLDFVLSPVKGVPNPKPRFLYSLPLTPRTSWGSYFPMTFINRPVVHRTWGLHEAATRKRSCTEVEKASSYGPEFKYDEFLSLPSIFHAIAFSTMLLFGALSLAFIPPVRWLVKTFAPPGSGPSDDKLQKGFVEVTNITSSTTVGERKTSVKSTFRGRGDPGYLLSSVMISESALGLLLDQNELPAHGRQGGILTPMSALGDVLLDRLRQSGRFEIESEVILSNKAEEARKVR
ncbi:hypothetical protein SERLA73DRAFT_178436 [Serpula lacrymans var. lacrymans S7.3]|uniref:Saccharopine dehydrogenase NADP binding domain-containing protein n=2 Tax=Serpula lacrymans var. lacrymans TaxID=341189 RepID=F8PRM3_SERL3|nr:uncharacterized protein SERLADRAFT_462883 [Serpula lacrymans var. lacrymans S7.9]EGO00593.1 hypothetical protein SERLA73DRAFT_178436 [Serpula lacrymans var. lacrymans S7.3]EGO26148.1 hypothetical protein SERLADRAFT_462883 [Serpula lacrymans var. lacrymans S7.9]